MIENKKNKEKWNCLDCRHQETLEYIENILRKLQAEEYKNSGNLEELELQLQKLQTLLHPQHYLIVDIKQTIAAALREIVNDIRCCPGRKIYERKIVLCKDILKVLEVIAPGISRHKAIVLYEWASTWAEYNRMRYQEKELSKKDLRVILFVCLNK